MSRLKLFITALGVLIVFSSLFWMRSFFFNSDFPTQDSIEDIRFADDKKDVLGLFDSAASDAGELFHAQFLHGLTSLLFRAVLLASAFFAVGILLVLAVFEGLSRKSG